MALILEDDTLVPELTADERAWAKKLDALLGKMPQRLKLIEVDDSLVQGCQPTPLGMKASRRRRV